jgi:putative ABC transport system substrate-binding protein
MRNKLFIFFSTIVFLTTFQFRDSQSSQKAVRIGYLGNSESSSRLDTQGKDFLDELRLHGWIAGQNIALEQRFWENQTDRLIAQTRELIGLKADVIVTNTGTAAQVVKKATTVIPIVMVSSADAITQELAISLARPGGNVTGLTTSSTKVMGKQLELIKEAFPMTARVALLRCGGPRTSIAGPGLFKKAWNDTQHAAQFQKIQLFAVGMRGSEEMEGALATIRRERADALVVSDCVRVPATMLIEFAAKSGLPALYPYSRFARRGGLMSYGADETKSYRRAAQFVDKILRGANPAELPIEQPTAFELVINLKTARQMGLTIPNEVLMWASEVIK